MQSCIEHLLESVVCYAVWTESDNKVVSFKKTLSESIAIFERPKVGVTREIKSVGQKSKRALEDRRLTLSAHAAL